MQSILAVKERTGEIQIIPEDTAYIMHTLLQGVVNHGTATRIRTKSHFYGQAAGKTGTTSGWYDAWFCGYTADLTGILWMGFDRRTISLGRHRSGGNVAAPLWGRMMKDVYKTRTLKKFDFKVIKTTANFITLQRTVKGGRVEEGRLVLMGKAEHKRVQELHAQLMKDFFAEKR